MESIFKDKNVPLELTRLPFVESFFNPNAVSKRRASGIWQFMPATGKEYLRVERHYDERNDPILSTYAAADELLKNYRYLNCWTLAVTAYNHGRYGIKRALKSSNSTTLTELIKNHKGKNFGFDTKNFYAEFLAALYIEKNSYKFFDDLIYADKHNVKTIVIKHSMDINKLEELLDIDKQNIKYYNPALSNPIINGKQKVPEGARINIPVGNFEKFTSKLEKENIKNYVRVI
jgi:membrane-bound lytic murein transglycosylase D